MRHLVKTVAMLALALSCFAQTSRPQPVAKDTNVIAVVLGKQIIASETNELTGIILGSLMEQFAIENSIEPTPEELDALIRKTDETGKQQQIRMQEERAKLIEELRNPSLSGSEREKKEARLKRLERLLKFVADKEKESMENEEQAHSMKREVALSVARPWKINQALYRKYGGRVVFQQAGVEPLDAYRDFLKEHEKKGNFKILNKTCGASFWGYFTNDAVHTFYSEKEGAKFINTPFWMSGQTKPAVMATNTTVSTAEVTAFMQAPNSVFDNSPDPKRVSLLLAAIEREPAGPWVSRLQGFCFGIEHAGAFRLPPAKRSEVYVRAIEYLTAARETVSTAFQANPRSLELKDNLGTLDVGLALACVEFGTRTQEAHALAEAVLASNTVTNWNYGNLIYGMHSLLGRVALREGDVAAAKRHLAASGKTPGSPQLNSFGPDFVLAGELLQKGERDAVLEHLDKIAVFWANPDDNPRSAAEHQKKIDAWKQTIRAGQIPNDHQWQAAGLSLVDSKPTDENAVRNARRQICGNQLKWIEVAKQSWALDKQKPEDATPAVGDLAGYLEGGKLPKCPDGGTYVIGKLNQNPRCSVVGHELSKRPN